LHFFASIFVHFLQFLRDFFTIFAIFKGNLLCLEIFYNIYSILCVLLCRRGIRGGGKTIWACPGSSASPPTSA
jgi:hypothetical protein